MPSRTIDLAEAQEHLADLIDEARRGGEVIITSHDEPVAKLVAVRARRGARKAGSAAGLITISDDFDEPLEDLKYYNG